MSSRNANLYITLTDFKTQLVNPTDTADDSYIEQCLEEASRSIDDMTGRFFYPQVDTLYFDTPVDDRVRFWYDDLLEPLTVTNGSEGALSSSDYYTIPYNRTPYIALALTPGTGIAWQSDSDNITTKAIQLAGIWGFRQNYARDGWHAMTTLSGAEDADTTAIGVAEDTGFAAGDIIRVDNELMKVTVVGTLSLTVERAWNGSTGATHDNGATVKRWYTEPAIVRATGIQAHRLLLRRNAPFGTVSNPQTGAMSILSDVDVDVARLIHPFVRMF